MEHKGIYIYIYIHIFIYATFLPAVLAIAIDMHFDHHFITDLIFEAFASPSKATSDYHRDKLHDRLDLTRLSLTFKSD